MWVTDAGTAARWRCGWTCAPSWWPQAGSLTAAWCPARRQVCTEVKSCSYWLTDEIISSWQCVKLTCIKAKVGFEWLRCWTYSSASSGDKLKSVGEVRDEVTESISPEWSRSPDCHQWTWPPRWQTETWNHWTGWGCDTFPRPAECNEIKRVNYQRFWEIQSAC